MMILIPLIIFLAFIILLACSQTPSGESAQKPPGGMGVPPPPTEDFGVSCFVEFGDSISAGAPSFHHYSSKDGGLSWDEASDVSSMGGSDCCLSKRTLGALGIAGRHCALPV